MRLLLSLPMHLLGHPEDSLQILLEGKRLSEEIGDQRNLLNFQSKLGSYYALHGEHLLAVENTENPFREAERIQDIEMMAPIACELCSSYTMVGECVKIVDVASKVLALLKKTQRERDFFGGRYNVYSGLCGYCIFAFGLLGSFDECEALYEEGRHLALEVRSLYGLGFLELCYGHSFLMMGDGANVIDHMEKSISYYEEAQVPYHLGAVRAFLGHGYYLTGELETAKEYIEKGHKIHTDMGQVFWLSFQFLSLGMVHFDRGDLESAQNHIGKAVRLSENKNEKHWEGISKLWLGRMLGKAETSEAATGEEYILEGIRILDGLKLRPWTAQGYLFLGELHARRVQRKKALENLNKAQDMFKSMGMDYWLAKTEEVLRRL
jgi:tetratricopeptide (TPR) repeat protein